MYSVSGRHTCGWPKFPRAYGESKGSTIPVESCRTAFETQEVPPCQQEVKYQGYVVSSAGVSADLDKVKAVQDFPTPKDLKQLRSFLGLALYYRRFIPNFSHIAAPLYELTKKDALYQWTPACQVIFDELKQ